MYPYEIIQELLNELGDTGKTVIKALLIGVALWALVSGIIIIF